MGLCLYMLVNKLNLPTFSCQAHIHCMHLFQGQSEKSQHHVAKEKLQVPQIQEEIQQATIAEPVTVAEPVTAAEPVTEFKDSEQPKIASKSEPKIASKSESNIASKTAHSDVDALTIKVNQCDIIF